MGTGVGEAMLIGAAVGATAGGAGAAIQGGDPLKGALLGGAMGGVGGGLGAGFGATGGTLAGGTSGTAAGGTSGAVAGGTGSAVGSLSPTVASLAGSAPASTFGAFSPAITSGIGAAAPTGGAIGALAAPTSGIASLAVPTGSALAGTGAGAVGGTGGALAGNFTGFAPALSNTALATIGGTSLLGGLMQAERDEFGVPEEDYVSSFDPSKFRRSEPTYAPGSVYVPQYKDYTTAAEGGIMRLANGGPVERMSMMNTAMNPQGGLYPQGMIDKTQYATPTQRPVSAELISDVPAYERSNPMLMNEGGIAGILGASKAQGLTPEAYQNIYGRGNAIIEMEKALKEGKMVNLASGGISSLGGYSDGGRMLKGPGDGMSDSIPGVIANKQPARLADGEFVVPADVVSHLGNGSTDAGAKQLYAMMDKVRKARTGKKKQAPAVKANRYMPA
jgi:hypothetical protein